jgi:hypothetical protein
MPLRTAEFSPRIFWATSHPEWRRHSSTKIKRPLPHVEISTLNKLWKFTSPYLSRSNRLNAFILCILSLWMKASFILKPPKPHSILWKLQQPRRSHKFNLRGLNTALLHPFKIRTIIVAKLNTNHRCGTKSSGTKSSETTNRLFTTLIAKRTRNNKLCDSRLRRLSKQNWRI